MFLPHSILHQSRLLLCIRRKSCCIRPVHGRLLLPLRGSLAHSRGRRNNRGQVSRRSLLSSGLLNATAVSRGTLQQRDQKQWPLRLPALSCRFDLYWIFIHVGFNGETNDRLLQRKRDEWRARPSPRVLRRSPLLFRTPVCHQRALFPFSNVSGWLLLSRWRKRRPAGVDSLLTWKQVPAGI